MLKLFEGGSEIAKRSEPLIQEGLGDLFSVADGPWGLEADELGWVAKGPIRRYQIYSAEILDPDVIEDPTVDLLFFVGRELEGFVPKGVALVSDDPSEGLGFLSFQRYAKEPEGDRLALLMERVLDASSDALRDHDLTLSLVEISDVFLLVAILVSPTEEVLSRSFNDWVFLLDPNLPSKSDEAVQRMRWGEVLDLARTIRQRRLMGNLGEEPDTE